MASLQVASLLLLLSSAVTVSAQRRTSDTSNLIAVGSTHSPSTNQTSWFSPSGLFAFGFYPERGKYAVGIWLVGNPNNTVIWTANRDDPLVDFSSSIVFSTYELVVRTYQEGLAKPIISWQQPADSASMLDSGNFVIYRASAVIWQSFDSPTDTLVVGQQLLNQKALVSSKSPVDHSSGRFHVVMQGDSNLVAYGVNYTNVDTDAYWATNTQTESNVPYLYALVPDRVALFFKDGLVTLQANSSVSDQKSILLYRATLDYDGNFRLYSHSFINGDALSSNVSVKWSALDSPCVIKGFCGPNSFCKVTDQKAGCHCFPGFDFVDESHDSPGCYRRSDYEQLCRDEESALSFSIVPMNSTTIGGHPYSVMPLSLEECSRSCSDDCHCEAALHVNDICEKKKLPIIYAATIPNGSSTVLIKKLMPAPPGKPKRPNQHVTKGKKRLILILSISLGSFAVLCCLIAVFSLSMYHYQVHKYERLVKLPALGSVQEFTLQSFSFNELEKATSGFREKLHKGSLWTVYKGAISDGKRPVAVKRLEREGEEGEQEFRAEMATVGRTHHKNLVRLLGFCKENSRKILVYEYLNNGPLADLLFNVENQLAWRERVRIAMEVARGILYLHEECDLQIIHGAITTRNILIDESWTAKISDFRLAKVLAPNQTGILYNAKGKRIYAAPELHKHALLSTKVDIYSFGVVLLETVCCRSNMVVDVSTADEVLLSTWVHKCYVARELKKLIMDDEQVDMKSLEKMVKVGLLCIQDDPSLRPSIKDAILMLEGTKDIPDPPFQTMSSVFS
ncbi:G-type lectin S-receptor-like serine/threonine-protein kinase LECRK1 [Syzygium oleosum]|uniref:G-type lectin S-receptor-like serine/threonine-protein kinase LECRK1 n=1 Tax=Syzygium oleosum TaxID=219896 RepID=UPI0024BA620D|nr:G-type lectin S-receptor-like serine/threonine-protein kinase LECRK1 [Syzygium oleosum]